MMSNTGLQAIESQQRRQLWAMRVQECRNSGKSVKEWCAEQGLSYHTYYKWQQKLFHECCESQTFYEVNVGSPSTAAITIHSGACTIDVNNGADEALIAAVLRAVKSC